MFYSAKPPFTRHQSRGHVSFYVYVVERTMDVVKFFYGEEDDFNQGKSCGEPPTELSCEAFNRAYS